MAGKKFLPVVLRLSKVGRVKLESGPHSIRSIFKTYISLDFSYYTTTKPKEEPLFRMGDELINHNAKGKLLCQLLANLTKL